MKIIVKQRIDIKDKRTIRDLNINVKSFPYEHELFRIESDEFTKSFKVGQSVIGTALSEYLAASFRYNCLVNHQGKKHSGMSAEIKKLKDSLTKLEKTQVITMMCATSITVANEDSISVGYSGAKLGMLAPIKEVTTVDALRLYNPFNIDFSNVTQTVTTQLFKFDRFLEATLDEYTLQMVMADPVSTLHLGAYIEEMANCYSRVSVVQTVLAPINLLAKMRSFSVIDDSEYQLVENLPRSLEELFCRGGYKGNLPISDSICGQILNQMGTNQSYIDISCLDLIVLTAINNGVIPKDFSFNTLFQGRTLSVDRNALEYVREMFRCLVYINDIKPDKNYSSNGNADLANCILKIDLYEFLSRGQKNA